MSIFLCFLFFHSSSLSTISDVNGELHCFVAGQWGQPPFYICAHTIISIFLAHEQDLNF